MKVYIVEEPINFDETRIAGVFKSKLKAERLKKKLDKKFSIKQGVECDISEQKIK